MKKTRILSKEKISFIKSFSKKEWLLNGWNKEDPALLQIYEMIALFVKDGNYLELGCGSGILCRFLYLFSGKKIVPYGIDINLEAIKIAKKNHPEFSDNFIVGNYFESFKSNTFNLKRFSTISIFVSFGEHNWKKLRQVLTSIIKECKRTNFLIIAYDYDFFSNKEKEIGKFISAMRKISLVSIAGHSISVIGKDKKIHTTAKKLRKNILEHKKYTKYKFIAKKTIRGIIAEKNSSSFYLIEEDNLKQKKPKKIRFSLTSKQHFSEFSYSPAKKIVSERIIDWIKIKNGDRVIVIFGKDKQKKIVYSVKKFIKLE